LAAAHPSRHSRARPLALAAIILAALATGGAAAAPGSSIEVLARDTGSAGPIGWLRLCARQPGECLPAVAETRVAMTKERWMTLAGINEQVNRRFRQVSDPAGQDDWRADAVARGDCEDMALAKRRLLLAEGWPRGALRLVVALVEGEHHLVLAVETTEGTLVLDNLQPAPMPWGELPYRWVMLERPSVPAWWSDLAPVQPASDAR
jgi:predicted transglutaminase-like cysteine proteinase